jgi:hypothetical protein
MLGVLDCKSVILGLEKWGWVTFCVWDDFDQSKRTVALKLSRQYESACETTLAIRVVDQWCWYWAGCIRERAWLGLCSTGTCDQSNASKRPLVHCLQFWNSTFPDPNSTGVDLRRCQVLWWVCVLNCRPDGVLLERVGGGMCDKCAFFMHFQGTTNSTTRHDAKLKLWT